MTEADPNANSQQPSTPGPSSQVPSIFPLVFTVMLDLLGFAMFLPDLQLRGERLAFENFGLSQASGGWKLGLLIGFGQAVYSIAQLATGTWLGRMSDIRGRKVVLLASAALSVVAYAIYAFSNHLVLMWISRALSGVAAANLGVAYAYVADITKPEERSSKMGLLGAAFGVGFLLGPPLGAGLLMLQKDSPLLLGLFAAGLSLVNVVLIQIMVKEPPREKVLTDREKFSDTLRRVIRVPGLGPLVAAFFVIQLAFTNLETTYFRLIEHPNWIFNFGSNSKLYGALILVVVGLTGALTQSLVVPKVVKAIGDLRAFRYFYTAFIPVFASVPYGAMPFPGLIGTVLLGMTNGIAGSASSGLLSRSAPPDLQGTILGFTQSLGSLARIVSPLAAGFLFDQHPTLPYWWGAILAVGAAYLIWYRLNDLKPAGDSGASIAMH
jgi:MFS transporter, DHA1 family, tetracycline resistance protein